MNWDSESRDAHARLHLSLLHRSFAVMTLYMYTVGALAGGLFGAFSASSHVLAYILAIIPTVFSGVLLFSFYRTDGLLDRSGLHRISAARGADTYGSKLTDSAAERSDEYLCLFVRSATTVLITTYCCAAIAGTTVFAPCRTELRVGVAVLLMLGFGAVGFNARNVWRLGDQGRNS